MRRVSSVLMMMIVAAEKNYEVSEANHAQANMATRPNNSETDVALGVATPFLR